MRLDLYLHVDNIRPQLEISIRGLGACYQTIENEAKGAWWRKRDKEAAVKTFLNTLSELVNLLQRLTSDFFPGGSGMGVETLVPIYKLISGVRNDMTDSEIQLRNEELGELACQALRDDSHEEWFQMAAEVEALVAELELAFSVKVTEEKAHGS